MTDEEREKLMSMNLDEKINQSKKIIKEALEKFDTERLAIAWTGGKDSTTMTWLFREACKDLSISMPKCMFIDEGSVFDEIWDLVNLVKKEWNLDVVIAKNTDISDKANNTGDMIRVSSLNERNRSELAKLEFDEEEFPFEPESFVGNHLMKTVAMNVFLEENKIQALATAIRWDEQEARVAEGYFSTKETPPHTRVQPILHFKERDIWNSIHTYKLPFCELYKLGYRSLGAKGSTVKNSDIPAWEQDLENTTERAGRGQSKEEVMGKLRSLGYM
ncbi:MAG: phosphoadenosine phosphosulfate reductase family protein [Nitrospiraceae bacterium]|nr:MAG: phosphoadenosine phosphosulfate reductase family protein [Nitrospiraceae bacterium]